MPSGRRRSRYTVQGPYQKNGSFHIVFYDTQGKQSPQRKWVSLRTDDEVDAAAEWRDLRDAFWLGEYDPWEEERPTEGVTMQAAMDEYLAHYRQQVREKTWDATRRVLKLFKAHIGEDYPIQAVSSGDVQEWLQKPKSASGGAPSAATLQTYRARLSQWMQWAAAQGYREGDPTESVPVPDSSGDTFSVLSPRELNALLNDVRTRMADAADRHPSRQMRRQWVLDVVQLLAVTGMRIGEALAIRWKDVSRLDAGSDLSTIHVRPYATEEVEAGSEGWSPKNRGSVRQLQVWPRGTYVLRGVAERHGTAPEKRVLRGHDDTPLQYSRVANVFRDHAESAGLIRRRDDDSFVRRVRLHDLRHTYISWMVNEFEHQLGVRTVADMVGHEDIQMTDQYRRADPQSQRDAMLRAAGAEQEGGRRPTYERVREWLHAEPIMSQNNAESPGFVDPV